MCRAHIELNSLGSRLNPEETAEGETQSVQVY